MNTFFKNIFAIGLMSSLVIGCNDEKKAAQMPPQKIPVVKVMQQDVPIYNEMVGQVYGLKDIPIRARVDGFLEKIAFDEGSTVKEGQLLYEIDDQPFLADVSAQKSKLAEAKTLLVNAKNELDRYKPLAEMNAVSKSDLDAAQANYDASIASVDAAKANLRSSEINLGYCTIYSPIKGIIGKTEAREGEYVGKDPNPVILNTVSRIDTIRVQFSISESKYLTLAKAYRKAHSNEEARRAVDSNDTKADVELILADGSIYEEKGNIDFVNSNIDANTGSLLVQASFPNPSRLLRPGLYAKVRIQFEVAKKALVIPQRCVIEIQGQYSVFAVGENNTVVSKPVVVGYKMGDLVLIESGLVAEDRIVIDAIQKVGSGTVIEPELTTFTSKTNE
jgi:membrane fusion protein (multidrug efflux system)